MTKLVEKTARILAQFKMEASTEGIFRNMFTLATGIIVARVISIATMPIISRMYTPDHLGVLAVFVSAVALVAPAATLRYSSAIPLPKQNGMAVNLFALCLICLALVSILSFLLLWLLGAVILSQFGMNELLSFWWLLVVALAGVGLFEVLSAWAIREKAFKPLAKTKIWQSFFSDMVKIGLGLLGFKPVGLLIGHIVSQAGGCTSLSFSFYPKFKTSLRKVSIRRLVFVSKRYADFPKFRLPAQFFLAFSVNSPLLFSAILYGKETTGQLGLALTTLALPIALFGNTTGQAYYAEIAKIGRKNPYKIRQITKGVTKKLFLVSIPPFLLLLLTGPWLFSVVFGAVWRDAGMFASGLAVYLLTQFVSAPLINVLSVFEKQWLFLRINLVRSLLLLFVFGFVYLFKIEALIAIYIYGCVLAVHYTVVSIAIFRIIK